MYAAPGTLAHLTFFNIIIHMAAVWAVSPGCVFVPPTNDPSLSPWGRFFSVLFNCNLGTLFHPPCVGLPPFSPPLFPFFSPFFPTFPSLSLSLSRHQGPLPVSVCPIGEVSRRQESGHVLRLTIETVISTNKWRLLLSDTTYERVRG